MISHSSHVWRLMGAMVMGTMIGGILPVRGATPVFTDDFSTTALLAEKWTLRPAQNWTIGDGSLRVAPGGAAGATPKLSAPVTGPIEVTCRVKCDGFDVKGGWCGIRVRGIHFTLMPKGFGCVYRVEGQERAVGKGQLSETPVVGRWYEFRIVQNDHRYVWYVDGAKAADFLEPNEVVGVNEALSLATSGPAAAYDNLSLTSIPADGNASPNVMRNASFEVVPDHVPLYWQPNGVAMIPPEVYWRDWGVDTTQAYDGKQSLRMAVREKGSVAFFSYDNTMAIGQPCTFSIYLKASRPGLKARLRFWEFLGKGHATNIVVDAEWKRYAFTLVAPEKLRVRCGVELVEAGALWADAAQIEAGTQPTSFRPADLDVPSTPAIEAAAAVPPARMLAVSATAPQLDGKLDDAVWSEAARVWPLVRTGGGASVQPTDASMVLSGDTLYIGMRCHDTTTTNLQATATQHDAMVFGDDCVEIMLDTHHDGVTYYHLAVNPLGTRFDAGPGRNMGWNQTWDAKTFVTDTFWSVEIALPLSSLDVTPMTSDAWGVNLCRHSTARSEFSSVAVAPTLNFHCPDRYPVLNWPAGALDAHRLYPQDWKLTADAAGALRLSGFVVNRTGSDLQVKLGGTLDKIPWAIPTLAVSNGQSASVAVDSLAVPVAGRNELPLHGVITDPQTGRQRREFTVQLSLPPSAGSPEKAAPATAASGAHAVPIDPVRRCLVVDGQPYFVVAPLLSLFPNTKPEAIDLMVNHHADNGFRTLMVVAKINEPWCDKAWARFLDQCAARNIKVVAWPGGFGKDPPELHVAFINKWKNHPALIAWMPVDEPELGATPEATRAHIDLYKKTDPDHPVYVNNTYMGIPSRFAGLPGDIVSIDDYLTNREGRKVREIVHQVDLMEAVAGPSRRPTWIFIVGNNLHNHHREPSAAEQVAQSYGCAIAGANGLLYFLANPAGKQHWFALRQLNRELMDLGPVLLSSEPAPSATCSVPDVRFTVRRSGAHVYLLAVNLENRAHEAVRFDVAGLKDGEAVILFEDRLADVEAGIITDRFAPHERHVYRFTVEPE